ncbi:MAG: class I SAM-dependent RNA methyltransferase [Acidimicrobiales bacterium]
MSPVRLELEVSTMASDGRAVARAGDGKVTFVEGALPGETVSVDVIDERSSYRSAVLRRVLEASPDRVEPPCPAVALGCGGCRWQHVSVEAQRRLKETIVGESLSRIARIPGSASALVRPTVPLAPWRYRTTIRAGVAGGRPGLRRARSHDLVAVADCPVADVPVAQMLATLEFPGAREVVLRSGARTAERMAAPTPQPRLSSLPPGISATHIHERAGGRLWRVSAGSFFQTRPDGVDTLASMVNELAGELRTPGRAVDLYSGVGVFAGVLAQTGWQVAAVEWSRSSVRDAQRNLAGLTAKVVRSKVADWAPSPADLVVADPSRQGLGAGGANTVVASGASLVALVSCDVASLGRDARLLVDAGYQLRSATPIDMFPHTPHVEVLSVFQKPT